MALIKLNTRSLADDSVTTDKIADDLQKGRKNLIINGEMRIDQRQKGASVTIPAYTSMYVMDRWHGYGQPDASKYSLRRVAATGDALAAGHLFCAEVTSAGAHTQTANDIYFIRQFIEGNQMAHLRWGTSDAKSCVLSFWVKSHKTGTHGGAILDAVSAWSHPFTYSVSSANTWEYKTVSIAGPTAGGTFNTNNNKGCQVVFSLSVGSSFDGTAGAWANTPNAFGADGAVNVLDAASTWSITGVQLEKGTVATPYEFQNTTDLLAQCYRYYYKIGPAADGDDALSSSSGNSNTSYGLCYVYNTSNCRPHVRFPVKMRAAPGGVETSGTGSDYKIYYGADSVNVCSAVPTHDIASCNDWLGGAAATSGVFNTNEVTYLRSNAASSYLAWSVEFT